MLLKPPPAIVAQLQARAVHQQVHGLAACPGAGVPRPQHFQRRRPTTERRVIRHAQAEAEQAEDGADQPLGLPVSEVEHVTLRERRQDGKRRVLGMPAARSTQLRLPILDGFIGEPQHQAAALAQTGVVGWPVRHPTPRLRDVKAAVLVQLERRNEQSRSQGREATVYSAQFLSTDQPIHAPR